MKLRISFLSPLLLFTLVVAIHVSGSASSPPKDAYLGIPPEDVKYYKSSSEKIKCKDNSKKFTKDQLNDDFCDCLDGTDEPGTSACPSGKFYCGNLGHTPIFIFSSRVNDGICDCCDGSDEYDGQAYCPNSCWEAGRAAREKLNKKIATYQEGVGIRKKEIEQAKLAISKDEAELSKLKSEEKILQGLVQQLKERKDQIEKAEEEDRLKKEKEGKEKNETEVNKGNHDEKKTDEDNGDGRYETEETDRSDDKVTEGLYDHKTETMEDSASEQSIVEEFKHGVTEKEECQANGIEKCAAEEKKESPSVEGKGPAADLDFGTIESSKEELNKEDDGSADALSKEELGRLVASRWTGENAEKKTGEGGYSEDDHTVPDDSQGLQNEENDGYASETDDEILRSEDDDIDDRAEEGSDEYHLDSSPPYTSDHDDEPDLSDTTESNPSWLEKIQQTVRNILQRVKLFQKPVDLSEAAHVRKEYDDAAAKLSKIQSRILSLTKKLKLDFGQDKEFYSFYNRCFESKQNKYVYKVCPFKQATQEEGYTTTRLGQWDKFGDSYRMMIFSNGDRCWNGPDRSLKVKLRCGLNNEITDVDEPSRCEYVALLSTPALCTEEKLKELQDKLDAMNKEQPVGHDEL